MTNPDDLLTAFIEAACVPLDRDHRWGTLERAEAILGMNPEIRNGSIHAAAILGNDGAVRQFLTRDGGNATVTGGPRNWDALTHLCFSRYLRLDLARSDGFVRAAAALLDAGASANAGWMEENHQPHPEWESVLYGAAGVAHHAELTRLLLERGADPDDGETVYHTPETYDNSAMKVLVEVGKPNADSLATLLLRKHDWHDYQGIKWLLEHGADPNRSTRWGYTALQQAVRRDNAVEIVEMLLDHGADPTIRAEGTSAIAMAARQGRGDVLELFARRGVPLELQGVELLLAALARGHERDVRAITSSQPEVVSDILASGAELLGEFVGIGNTDGVRLLLDLGVDVGAVDEADDGYWGIAKGSTALHVAAWRARHSIVRLLIERGAPVDATDGQGRTPLALAVRACVDSHWTERRSPESVEALLQAGASAEAAAFPSGYPEIDALLSRYRRNE